MNSNALNWKTALAEQNWQQAITQCQFDLINNVQHAVSAPVHAERLFHIGLQAKAAQQHDLAIQCLLSVQNLTHPHPSQALLSQLSEIYGSLKQFAQAKHYATLSLNLRDKEACAFKPTQNAVAFSLFGGLPEYCENAILNAQMLPQFYPNWLMVVYHDDSVPAHVLQRLSALQVKLINVATINASHMPGTFWRFLALEDLNFADVVIRDIDSLPSEREKILVEEWLNSDKPYHVIRDWFGHTDLILAGLWGVKCGLFTGIRSMIDAYLQQTAVLHPTHADQMFLAQYVWPRIKNYTLHHSWISDGLNATWPASLTGVQNNTQALGAYLLKQITPNVSGSYIFTFKQNNQVICSYNMPNGGSFLIPTPYWQKVENNEYQFSVFPFSIESKP